MNKKKKRELTNEEIDENIFEMCNICSTTDCTGLIQVVPRTEAELESYEELYPFRPPFLPCDDDQMEDNANAIARFNILVKKFPESNVRSEEHTSELQSH